MREVRKFAVAAAASVLAVALFWLWWLSGQQRAGEPWQFVPPQNVTVAVVWTALLVLSGTVLGGTFEYTARSGIRLAGVGGLLVLLVGTLVGVGGAGVVDSDSGFATLNLHGMYGVVALGVAVLIVTGEIDLSLGSVVGLSAVGFGVLMKAGVPPIAAAGLVILGGAVIGLGNGLLVTLLRLQSFLVTLCGMLAYRGLARSISPNAPGFAEVLRDQPDLSGQLFALRLWVCGKGEGGLEFPAMFVVMLAVAAVLAALLHRTAYGRYWYAIGYNPRAALYAGVGVTRQRVGVFVVCSTLAAVGGILVYLDSRTADPNTAGESWELYAITAAVLGGVSLKGGQGTAVGVALGALIQPVIRKLINVLSLVVPWVSSSAEPWVTGLILLLGTIADELIRRRSSGGR